MSANLAGQRALITGASRGVGAAIARAFAAAGAEVVITARNLERLEEVRRTVAAAGGNAEVLPGDLSTRAAARELARRCGDVDILVNNAAVVSGKHQSLLVQDDEMWDLQFAVNLQAPVTLIQAFTPAMVAKGRGVVINISSIAVQRPNPFNAAYAAAKAGLESVTRAAALLLAATGVRINAIALGVTATAAWEHMLPPKTTLEEIGRRIVPIGRAIQANEVAAACLFLASDAAAAMTGSVITIDGGAMAGSPLVGAAMQRP